MLVAAGSGLQAGSYQNRSQKVECFRTAQVDPESTFLIHFVVRDTQMERDLRVRGCPSQKRCRWLKDRRWQAGHDRITGGFSRSLGNEKGNFLLSLLPRIVKGLLSDLALFGASTISG